MIKALIFDFDNTLIDRQKAFKEGLLAILSKNYDDQDLINKMIEDIIIWDSHGAVERCVAFKYWQDKYKPEVLTAEVFDETWKKESGKDVYLFEDATKTLTALKGKYKLALLTNGQSSSQRRKIKTSGIEDLFDYIIVSGEYICSKPDKRIFDYTVEQLKLQNEECVYIGDNYNIDVIGSRNANMTPIYVNRINEEHADVTTIYNLKELLNIF